MSGLLPALAALACAQAAAAAESITVRAGSHGDFGRIVFTLPGRLSYRMTRLGDLVVLTFPNAGDVPGLTTLPANVRSISGGASQAAIGLAPGAKPHVWQVDRRVIVDVFGAEGAQATPSAPLAPPNTPTGPTPPPK